MSLPLIGVTMGDPTGVGPEIIVKALAKEEPFQACRPLVFGDQGALLKAIKDLGVDATVEVFDHVPEEGYRPGKICLFLSSHLRAESLQIGKPDRECGEAMVNSIRLAVEWVMLGRIDAVTTCPINKQAINRAGYSFSGHTELLAHLTRTESVAMMFIGTKWKVVLVTTHLPLGEVPKWITEERVLNTIQMTDRGMKRYFGISLPRIAVLGLNPHGGEEGLLGKEEEAEIVPAIKRARALAVEVEGPFPADSFFDASRRDYDAVIAMYHDQGLIPIKIFGFMEAVNFTLGLPFIRTSVAHGTAYNIAGSGMADESNFIKAMVVASNLSKLKKDS
jgi:4-hydroxythreonine-4-phosphate dehydrogenase